MARKHRRVVRCPVHGPMAPVFKKEGGVRFECTAKGCTFGHSGKATSDIADGGTRDARYKTHGYFDRIWRNKVMPRDVAYQWLAVQMGYEGEMHIGLLDRTMCKYVQKLVVCKFPQLFTEKERKAHER